MKLVSEILFLISLTATLLLLNYRVTRIERVIASHPAETSDISEPPQSPVTNFIINLIFNAETNISEERRKIIDVGGICITWSLEQSNFAYRVPAKATNIIIWSMSLDRSFKPEGNHLVRVINE